MANALWFRRPRAARQKLPEDCALKQKHFFLFCRLVLRFSQPEDLVVDLLRETLSAVVACLTVPLHGKIVACRGDQECFCLGR